MKSVNLSKQSATAALDGTLTEIRKTRKTYAIGEVVGVKEPCWVRDGDIVYQADDDKPGGKGWKFRTSWMAPRDSVRMWLEIVEENDDTYAVKACERPQGVPEAEKRTVTSRESLERRVADLETVCRNLCKLHKANIDFDSLKSEEL